VQSIITSHVKHICETSRRAYNDNGSGKINKFSDAMLNAIVVMSEIFALLNLNRFSGLREFPLHPLLHYMLVMVYKVLMNSQLLCKTALFRVP
jgi:hypothetical protein